MSARGKKPNKRKARKKMMSEDMGDFLKKMMRHAKVVKTRKVEVIRLSGENLMRFKKHRSDHAKILRQAQRLIRELRLLKAKADKQHGELWEWLYDEYSLPPHLDYEAKEDGRIFKIIEEEESDS